MQKVLAYPLTVIYLLCFGVTLLVFHPLQWIAHRIFGYHAHKKVVDVLQWFIMRCLNILGTQFQFNNSHKISNTQPIIIVSNHQSMYDIPPLIWYFRKHHVKFVSKKELGKGIPSVSYNLRHGGSVLIDRSKPLASIEALENFAKKISENNWAAVIFPEGTRSRDGIPKHFKTKGLLTLLKNTPDGLAIPVTINNSWKTLRYGKFPMGLGAKITYTVHQPIPIKAITNKAALIKEIEQTIFKALI